ncbi:MAG TPA: YraN family protein [Acidimicrobiia bacterium]
MPDPRRALGRAGEAAVAAWYEAAGYDVLDRNWRCPAGELDLVVARDRTIVFCEVKTRRSGAFGTPAEAVTVEKQRRLRRLALHWLGERGVHGDLRFDVAAVRPGRNGLQVQVLQAAF